MGGGFSAGITTGVLIPANVLVLGVTGATNRYGSGLGLPLNSWSQGLLSAPSAVYAAQELRLTATGGNFAGGRVRLAVHWLALRIPDPL